MEDGVERAGLSDPTQMSDSSSGVFFKIERNISILRQVTSFMERCRRWLPTINLIVLGCIISKQRDLGLYWPCFTQLSSPTPESGKEREYIFLSTMHRTVGAQYDERRV